MKCKTYVAAAGAFLLASFLYAASLVTSRHAVVEAGGVVAPHFEVDPFWPKPLPNHWIIGETIGVSADANDNIWIIQRPNSLEYLESALTRNQGVCCTAAPDVLEFDSAGNVIRHWGKAEGHDWPTENHGITIDSKGDVWMGGMSAAQPGPPAGSLAQFGRDGAAPAAPASTFPNGTYHDSFILKFSPDGQFLGEIGHANGSKGSLDNDNVRGPAQMRFDSAGELIVADGYGNHRVSVWDPGTLKFKRAWGAYGKPPSDDTMPRYKAGDPPAQQFRNPVHCAQPSNDGLLYVCDRLNDRIQIFKTDGTFVKEVFVATDTLNEGSVWEIAFSRDPQQKYAYVSDGTNEQIYVFDRASMQQLYSFGDGGRQPGQWFGLHSIVTDSKGNIFTTETHRGHRVQKFIYKGLAPVAKSYEGVAWPGGKK